MYVCCIWMGFKFLFHICIYIYIYICTWCWYVSNQIMKHNHIQFCLCMVDLKIFLISFSRFADYGCLSHHRDEVWHKTWWESCQETCSAVCLCFSRCSSGTSRLPMNLVTCLMLIWRSLFEHIAQFRSKTSCMFVVSCFKVCLLYFICTIDTCILESQKTCRPMIGVSPVDWSSRRSEFVFGLLFFLWSVDQLSVCFYLQC